MRETPRTEGMRWLRQAEIDVGRCRRQHEQGAFYLVCFLAQQASAKALKAILYAHGEELVPGHSVRQLCDRVANLAAISGERLERWGILDSYYIPTRYPNGLPGGVPAEVFNREASAGALALAEDVLAEGRSWFEREGQPGSPRSGPDDSARRPRAWFGQPLRVMERTGQSQRSDLSSVAHHHPLGGHLAHHPVLHDPRRPCRTTQIAPHASTCSAWHGGRGEMWR